MRPSSKDIDVLLVKEKYRYRLALLKLAVVRATIVFSLMFVVYRAVRFSTTPYFLIAPGEVLQTVIFFGYTYLVFEVLEFILKIRRARE